MSIRRWLLYALLIVVGSSAAECSEPGRFVIAGRDALLLSSPDLVATSEVRQAYWSSDGRFVVAFRENVRLAAIIAQGVPPREPPPSDVSLIVWDRESEGATTVWKAHIPRAGANGTLDWMPRSDVAYALVPNPLAPTDAIAAAPPGGAPPRVPAQLLLRVDARRGSVRAVSSAAHDAILVPSGTRPLAVVFDRGQRTVRIFRADGALQRVVTLPEGVTVSWLSWSSDGASLLADASQTRVVNGESKRQITPLLIDPDTGSVADAGGNTKAFRDPAPQTGLRLTEGKGMLVERGGKETLRPLWLEGAPGFPPALVTPNADWWELSPDGGGVLYVASGSAWVIPLLRVSAEAFAAAQLATARALLLNHGKQASLGILMYANEHQDQLPGAGDPVRDLVLGLKDAPEASVFDGFVYTYAGGKIGEGGEPSKTMMGYIPGPGGRVVVYVDGHVNWEADDK